MAVASGSGTGGTTYYGPQPRPAGSGIDWSRPKLGPQPNPKKKKRKVVAKRPTKGSGKKVTSRAKMPTRRQKGSKKATKAPVSRPPTPTYGLGGQGGGGGGGGAGGFGAARPAPIVQPQANYATRPTYTQPKPQPRNFGLPAWGMNLGRAVSSSLAVPWRPLTDRIIQERERTTNITPRQFASNVGAAARRVQEGIYDTAGTIMGYHPAAKAVDVAQERGLVPEYDVTPRQFAQNIGQAVARPAYQMARRATQYHPAALAIDAAQSRGMLPQDVNPTAIQVASNLGEPMRQAFQYHPAAQAVNALQDTGVIGDYSGVQPEDFFPNMQAAIQGVIPQGPTPITGLPQNAPSTVAPTNYATPPSATFADLGNVLGGLYNRAAEAVQPAINYATRPPGAGVQTTGGAGVRQTGVVNQFPGGQGPEPRPTNYGDSPAITSSETAGGNTQNMGGQFTKGVNGDAVGATADTTATRTGGGRRYPAGGYRRTNYGGRSRSYGGGGSSSGGGTSGDYAQYGMSDDWMNAYKEFWGDGLPSDMYGMYQGISDLFARYANRMPQLSDWQQIWQAIRAGDDGAVNMWDTIQPYEPLLQELFVRAPNFVPPPVSYTPGSSF